MKDIGARSRSESTLRALAVTFALAGMLLRGLLPEGWMPSASVSPLMLCSMDAQQASAPPTDTMAGMPGMSKAPAHTPMQDRSHAPCAFAAAAPLSPPPAVLLGVPPTLLATRFGSRIARLVIVRSAAHRPNAARAPPLSLV